MPVVTDFTGRTVVLSDAPQRIISLVPSQTELLYDLGLEKKVVGITKFCVHPDSWFRTKTRVGGTKNLSIGKIRALQPDLIIANKEENVKEQIEELSREFPVFVTDVNTVKDAFEMIRILSIITGASEKGIQILDACRKAFPFNTTSSTSAMPLRSACYLIWREPYMTIGGDTFISDMMLQAGYKNIYASHGRYPETSLEEIRDKACDILLLSSEPYPFTQQHIDEIQPHLPHTKIILVDGEYFSWYGSRMVAAKEYFKSLKAL